MATCHETSDALSRHLDRESSPAERARVEAHLASCAACAAEAQGLRQVDAAMRRAFAGNPFGPALARRIADAAAKRRTPSGRVLTQAKVIEAPWARIRRAWPAAAAAALLIAMGLVIRSGFNSTVEPAAGRNLAAATVRSLANGRVRVSRGGIGDVSYVTPGGELALRAGDVVLAEAHGGEITFEDGSRVVIRSDTQVAVRASESAEGVEIRGGYGELYCEVTKQPGGRTFQVETHSARVDVVGTRFGVRYDGGVTVATVLEGRVRLAPAAGGEVMLGADDRGRTIASGGAEVRRVRAREELSWILGRAPADPEPPVATPPPPPPLQSSPEDRPPAPPGVDQDLPIGSPR